jgi:hypothetical protein
VVVSREGKGSAVIESSDIREEERKGITVSHVEKYKTISKPWFVRRLRDQFRRDLFTGGTVSGIQVA